MRVVATVTRSPLIGSPRYLSRIAGSKSSNGSAQDDDCGEVAVTEQTAYVRDSKNSSRPGLAIGRDDWSRFVRYAGNG
ncbi:DUF397 domain-containing protein [Streptomyces zingiberis]|uniref:DUF397 domain-containing protein n=1 Tax=Streptomyces zingiberis TaxID=2053010 RepID=UPI0028929C6C|nr:DUF397 domain-containing protein [Streptomyces zingiberis]